MKNLSDLPYELLASIASRLKKLEDFTCFGSVSKLLHNAAKEEYFEGLRLRQGTPYLMLPVRDGNDNIRELYSLVEGESIVASLEVPKFKSKMCFESLGWLLNIEADRSMSLLDPFSGTLIPVPHQKTFPGYECLGMRDGQIFIQKMVLSSRPNETSDFILMIIAGGMGHLAFWRLGDRSWNRIVHGLWQRFRDVVYDGGEQFYAFSNTGMIWAIDFGGNDYPDVEGRIIVSEPIPRSSFLMVNAYILKTADNSLLGITRIKNESSFLTNEFHLYEFDTERKSWKEIYSLGSMAVFIGCNSSLAVDATRFGGGVIKGNHIYFTDVFWEINFNSFILTGDEWKQYTGSEEAQGSCVDSGVYDLETQTIEPIYPVDPLLTRVCPAMWITPNLQY